MTQLPLVQVMLESQHNTASQKSKAGEQKQHLASSSFQKGRLTTPKEQLTPTDFSIDLSMNTTKHNTRKQQQLTQAAEEKKGDEEQAEMENLQEILDNGLEGGSRIRSISHQFPSMASFLRASQDKMRVGYQQQTTGVTPGGEQNVSEPNTTDEDGKYTQ